MPALTQEKLNNQIDVVRNERLERYENQPYGLAWETLISNLYPEDHPYSCSTIGFMQDISYQLDEVKNFFNTYYSPANASLVIAGNFDADRTKELIEKYFGEIKSDGESLSASGRSSASSRSSPEKAKLEKEILLERKENVQLERIYFAWHTENTFSRYDASLEVLADILSGSKNARLYKPLYSRKNMHRM